MKQLSGEVDQVFPITRAATAVVFNDMINGNLRTGRPDHDAQIEKSGLIGASALLVERARKAGVPIVWIRVERRADRTDVFDALTDAFIANGCRPKPPVTRGSLISENVDELPIHEADHVILKPRIDPFIGTNLNLLLRSMAVDTILLGGYATNFGVESCARTAKDLNYNVVLLRDCCFNVDRDAHIWSLKNIMPNLARVMTSSEALDLLV